MYPAVVRLLIIALKVIKILFQSRAHLITENLALRQQLAAFKTKNINPKLSDMDRSFWVALRRTWSNWADTLIIVKPETVIDWQRRRFKKYWWRKSSRNRKPGRRPIDQRIIDLIRQMATENNWGAPRIYSELLMLGYDNVKQRTVSRYLRKFRSKHPDKKKQQSWLTFLKNHRDVYFSNGLLCRANRELPHLLCFLCYRACQKEDCSLECYRTPNSSMGQATVERGLFV